MDTTSRTRMPLAPVLSGQRNSIPVNLVGGSTLTPPGSPPRSKPCVVKVVAPGQSRPVRQVSSTARSTRQTMPSFPVSDVVVMTRPIRQRSVGTLPDRPVSDVVISQVDCPQTPSLGDSHSELPGLSDALLRSQVNCPQQASLPRHEPIHLGDEHPSETFPDQDVEPLPLVKSVVEPLHLASKFLTDTPPIAQISIGQTQPEQMPEPQVVVPEEKPNPTEAMVPKEGAFLTHQAQLVPIFGRPASALLQSRLLKPLVLKLDPYVESAVESVAAKVTLCVTSSVAKVARVAQPYMHKGVGMLTPYAESAVASPRVQSVCQIRMVQSGIEKAAPYVQALMTTPQVEAVKEWARPRAASM